MITHISRIATTPRAHDLGYGFLLTRVFEHFGVELKKKVDAQVIDEIGSSIIMGCGFALIKAGDRSEDQGVPTPSVPVPRPTPSQPTASTSTSSQQQLQDEIIALKGAPQEEQELHICCTVPLFEYNLITIDTSDDRAVIVVPKDKAPLTIALLQPVSFIYITRLHFKHIQYSHNSYKVYNTRRYLSPTIEGLYNNFSP